MLRRFRKWNLTAVSSNSFFVARNSGRRRQEKGENGEKNDAAHSAVAQGTSHLPSRIIKIRLCADA